MFDFLRKAVKKAIERVKGAEETEAPKPKRKKIEEKVKVGVVKKVKTILSEKIKLDKKEIEDVLEDFELLLLESDVAFEVAEEIKEELEKRLVGKEIEKKKLKEIVKKEIENIIRELLPERLSLLEMVERGERPYKIIFFGPNGAGKTTAIAKTAYFLKKNGFSVVISASDTFRAAAIEQLEEHGRRIGVKVIKGAYGADPSSVAYNAINHAKTKGIDVVLIDTAGRLEVNTNLMRELEKIVRVVKPNLKVFVVDSTGGNAIYDMVKEYNEMVGIDAVILTKVDLDSKGGVLLSIYKATGVPILFISDGQEYESFREFDKEEFLEKILSE